MGNKLYEENSVQAIANAIRSKLGVETTYKINEMASAIGSIVKPNGTTNITENGYHNVKAYEQAYVQVPTGVTPTGTTNIYTNGDHDVTNYATAHVAVPQPVGKTTITTNGTDIDIAQYAVADVIVPPNVGTKSITQNGVYNASSDNLDGYSQVTVNGFTPSYIKNPIEFDYDIGYISYVSSTKTGNWVYQNPSSNYSDIYTVEQGKTYRICTGEDYGDRFRGVVTETDVRTITSGYIEGLQFVGLGSVPAASTSTQFTASVTGYLVIQKSASNEDQILTYLYCVDDMNTDEPSGTKTITENGEGIDVAGYSAVDVAVPPFPPELMDVDAFILESDSTTITIEYDPTKNVAQVMSFLLYNRHIDRNTVYMTSARKNVYTNEWTNINYIIASSWNDAEEYGNSNPQYSCTVTFDSANETITVTTLSGTFKAGYPYMTMVLYDPYPVEEPEP